MKLDSLGEEPRSLARLGLAWLGGAPMAGHLQPSRGVCPAAGYLTANQRITLLYCTVHAVPRNSTQYLTVSRHSAASSLCLRSLSSEHSTSPFSDSRSNMPLPKEINADSLPRARIRLQAKVLRFIPTSIRFLRVEGCLSRSAASDTGSALRS
ncbi:hypothetical protein VTK56DRAFT_1770 [Thermocarpiscus australiensis]